MGLSGSKKTTTTTPIYGAQIEGAASDVKNVYKANAGNVQGISDQLTGMIPGMLERYNQGDAGVNASRNYVTETLGSDGSNPHLDQIISQSNDEVQNRLGASMRKMGLGPAGSSYQGVVGKELGKNALGMRYNDWNNTQGRKMQAAGMSPSLAAADVIGISPLLATAQLGANLPMDNATKYAASTAGLLGPYTNIVEKKSGDIGAMITAALQAAAMASDIRLKEDIRRVGKTDGGLPVYTYRYKGEPRVHMGVMAQEVAEMQPAALGPIVEGSGTVLYGEVR